MKSAEKVVVLAVALLFATAAVAPAQYGSEFVFDGYSKYIAGTPDAVGSVMEVYGILSTVGGLTYPISLDTANYQYTLYIGNMQVTDYMEETMFPIKYITYGGGSIFIYADAIGGGSAADYGNLPTFTDGELILQAVINGGYVVALDDFGFPTGDGFWKGSGSGTCDFIGGTQLDALMAAEYYLENWNVIASVVDDGAGITGGGTVQVPAGFHRLFDVKITPPNDPTATESTTWGQVKKLYD
jgi:hypothetical protein